MTGNTAVTVHLAGAGFGYLYYKRHWRLIRFWDGFVTWKRQVTGPRLRVYHGEPVHAPAPAAAPPADFDEHRRFVEQRDIGRKLHQRDADFPLRGVLSRDVALVERRLRRQRQHATALHPQTHARRAGRAVGDRHLVFLQYHAAVFGLRRPPRSKDFERQLRQMDGEKDAHDGKTEQEWVEEKSTEAPRVLGLVV